MEKSSVYNIGFKSLRLGEHLFEYQIDKTFFKEYKNEEIQDGDLSVKLLLNRKERLLSIDFQIEGHIKVACDRCLEDTKLEVSVDEVIYVKFGEEVEGNQDENIIFIPEDEYQIDIGLILNDFIILARPIQVIHSGEGDDVCNPKMLDKIKEYTEKNNTSATWSALEELRNKMSNKQ